MKKILNALIGVIALAVPAFADVTIDDIPSAGTLNGEEKMMVFRNSQPFSTTTGTISTDIALPLNVTTEFDCVVDASGGGDYTTINDAWNGGCYNMFIVNGSYTLSANLILQSVSDKVRIVGQSMEGVLIDKSTYQLRFYDPSPISGVSGDELSFTAGSSALTTDGDFTTWGIAAGDWYCPARWAYRYKCYRIKSIDSAGSLTIEGSFDRNISPDFSTTAVNDMFKRNRPPEHLENLTILTTGNAYLTDSTDTVTQGALYKNLYFPKESTGNIRLFDDGYIMNTRIENVFGPSFSSTYNGMGTIMLNRESDGYIYSYGGSLYLGNYVSDFSYDGGGVMQDAFIGNHLGYNASGIDFQSQGIVGIGNTKLADVSVVENLADSVNIPGWIYQDGQKTFKYDSASESYTWGESAMDPAGVPASTYNIAIGTNANVNASSLDGGENICIGLSTCGGDNGGVTMAGWDNLAMGYQSGYNFQDVEDEGLQSPDSNVCLGGWEACGSLTYGDNNVMVGSRSGQSITNGNNNVILGRSAGGSALQNESSNNVYIGFNARKNTVGVSNYQLFIDSSNTATDNPLIHGDFVNKWVSIANELRIDSSVTTLDGGHHSLVDNGDVLEVWNYGTGGTKAFTFDAVDSGINYNHVSLQIEGPWLKMNNANGPIMLNEVASTTNPTIVPDQADQSSGIGYDGAAGVTIVSDGTAMATFTDNTGTNYLLAHTEVTGNLTLAEADGPALLNEVVSATNPTIVPDKGFLGSGIGGNPAINDVAIIANGNTAIRAYESEGVYIESSGEWAHTGNLSVTGSFTATSSASMDYLQFDYANYDQSDADLQSHVHGKIYANTDDGTIDIQTDVSGVTIQVGQEVMIRARNAEVDTLLNGEVVYMSGSTSGDVPDVKRAQSDGTHAEAVAVGVVTADISAGGVGFVTCLGKVRGYDTAAAEGGTWNVGDVLYISATPGALTKTKPVSPNHATIVGMVTKDATNGIIFVSKPDHGYELNEIHTVDDAINPTATEGTVLVWDNANGRWTDSETHPYTRHVQLPVTEVGNASNVPDKGLIDTTTGCYLFDGGSSAEFLTLQFEIPDDWDGADMIFEIDTAPMTAMSAPNNTYTFNISYRSTAEGELLNQGTISTGTATRTGDTSQYYFVHPQFLLEYDDANQPLTAQDHVFIHIDRDDSDTYAGDVCVTAFEVIYTSTGLPRY